MLAATTVDMNEVEFQESRIKKIISEMDQIYSNIQFLMEIEQVDNNLNTRCFFYLSCPIECPTRLRCGFRQD